MTQPLRLGMPPVVGDPERLCAPFHRVVGHEETDSASQLAIVHVSRGPGDRVRSGLLPADSGNFRPLRAGPHGAEVNGSDDRQNRRGNPQSLSDGHMGMTVADNIRLREARWIYS